MILQHYPIIEAPAESAVKQYTVTIHPSTPAEGILNYSRPSGSNQLFLTPSNALQVQKLLKRVYAEEDAKAITKKVCKAAILAMVEATIQKYTNKGLVALNKRKENKGNRQKGNITNGNARVLNQELLDDVAATDLWIKEYRCQGRISLLIFEESRVAIRYRQVALALLLGPAILSS